MNRVNVGENKYFQIYVGTDSDAVNVNYRLTFVTADGTEYPVDGVFILRPGVAPDMLLPGLETDRGTIVTDREMRTNIPGVFAAGDCTGAPYQIAKSVGEGNIAALSAVKYLDSKKE